MKRCYSLFLMSIAAVLSLVSGCGPSYETVDHVYDASKSDQENLLGEWVCVEATKAGQPDEELVGKSIEFQKELVLMKARPRNNEWIQMGYSLESEQAPKRLVMNATPYGAGPPRVWIDLYRFENGSLLLCRGKHQVSPLSFESTADNGYSLLVYKRVK